MSTLNNAKSSSKVWLQELKTNRKTQVAMAMFLLVISYLGYELFATNTNAPVKRRTTSIRPIAGQPLEDAQLMALQKMPNLAGLHQAGELPSENRMYRDIFGFDTPPPPPPPPKPPPPPPPPKPPPTEAEKAAAERRAAMDREMREQPSDYQLIGIVQGKKDIVKGAFKKGNDVDFFVIGDEAKPNWKLVSLDEEEAQFQNTKFSELKFSLKFQTTGTSTRSSGRQEATNLY